MNTIMNTFSITDLRQNTLEVMKMANQNGVAYLFKHSRPQAALVDINYLKSLQDAYEDYLDTVEFDQTVKQKKISLKTHKLKFDKKA